MITCPNKKLKAWRDLVKVVGEDKSYLLWNEFEGIVPEEYYKPKNVVEKPSTIESPKPIQDNNPIYYQNLTNKPIEEYVASEKTIRDLAARLSDRIGIPIRFESDRSANYKGKIQNNTAVINLAHATLDTPIHEILGHPIIRAIKTGVALKQFPVSSLKLQELYPSIYKFEGKTQEEFNKYFKQDELLAKEQYLKDNPKVAEEYNKKDNNTSQLYQNLLKELEYGKGKDILDRIKEDYFIKNSDFSLIKEESGYWKLSDVTSNNLQRSKDLDQLIENNPNIFYTLEEQQEEAIVELLGLMTAEKLDAVKDGKLISLLKRLLKEIKAFVRDLLKQREIEIDKLPDNMTLGDIADLLAYSNSKLILPGYGVEYTTPDNNKFKTYIEASKHISELVKSIEEVDLNNTEDYIKQSVEKINNLIQLKKSKEDYLKSDLYLVDKSEKLKQKQEELRVLESTSVEKFEPIKPIEDGFRIENPERYGLNRIVVKNTHHNPEIFDKNHEDYNSVKNEFIRSKLGNNYSGFFLYNYDIYAPKNNKITVIPITEDKANELWEEYSSSNTIKQVDHDKLLEIFSSKNKVNDEISKIQEDYYIKKEIATLFFEIHELKKNSISEFINKNKEYEQSKEIIDEWKKVNNIQYNPEEVYSRGQEFVSVIGAYSNFDINLMMQNLLEHIEDNKKAGGKFAISAFTKPINKTISHLEGGGGKIKFKIYPQSEDILWAASTDVYSGSVWDASEKVSKDKKSELLGVSYTKYPSINNIENVQPNLASIIDNLTYHHNELGIVLTDGNFRLEYDEDIPYQTKRIIRSINSILDQKYGNLVKPEIKEKNIKEEVTYDLVILDGDGYPKATAKRGFTTLEEAKQFGEQNKDKYIKWSGSYKYEKVITKTKGIQPTKTNETLKESIRTIKERLNENNLQDEDMPFAPKESRKEYTSQALVNTKIARLKEVAKKYPRSLIRSEVKQIRNNSSGYVMAEEGELPFQLLHKEKVEKEKLVERLTRDYQAITTYYNKVKVNWPQLRNIHNQYIKEAITPDNKYIPEIDSPNKRYVVNKYFRLRDGIVKNKPYYPYNAGPDYKNEQLVKLINTDFGERVVRHEINKSIITFTENIDNAWSLQDEFNAKMQDAGLTESDLGLDTIDMLEADEVKNNTQLQAWEEVINRKKALQKILIRRLAEGAENAPSIRARLSRIESQIEQLQLEKQEGEVDKIAKEDLTAINRRLNDIQANLEKDLNEDQLLGLSSELEELSAYTKGWLDLNKIRGTLDMEEADKAHILRLSAGFAEAHELYSVLLQAVTLAYANKVSYKKFTSDDLYAIQADDGMLSSNLLGASMSNVNLIKITQDILNKAESDIHNEQLDKEKALNDKIKELKAHTGINDIIKISEMFLQYDKNGKWTGNMISQIKQEYWDQKKELNKLAKETGDWSAYFSFLDEKIPSKKSKNARNTYALTEKEYNTWKKLKDAGEKIDYSEISKQRMSDGEIVFTEKDFLEQEKLINIYEKDKQAYIDDLIMSGKYGTITKLENGNLDFDIEEFRSEFWRDVDYWDQLWNPFKPDPKYKNTRFKKYRIFDKVDSKWNDPKYDKVKNDPVLKDFYDFFRNQTNENDKELPNYDKKQSNFLVNIPSSPLEYITQGKGFKRTIGALKDEFIKSWTEEVDSPYEKSIEIAGKLYKSIPVGLLHAEIPIEQRSKNIFEMLEAHTNLALSFKHKANIQPVVNGIQDIIEELHAAKTVNIGGETVLKRNFISDRISGKKGGLSHAIKQLDNLVNARLYGDNKVEDFKGKKEYKLEGGEKRVFSLNKFVDAMNKFTYLKALAIPNIVSPMSNIGIGTVNNFIWASANQDYNEASLTKAYAKILPTVMSKLDKTNRKDTIKVLTFLSRLNVIPDINTAEYINKQSWEELLTIMQSKGEYVNQGASAIAYLLHNKLLDKNGKEVSIYDAFIAKDGNLVWDTNKMGERTETSPDELITSDKHGINIYRLERMIKGINYNIHGDYDSTLLIKQNALGRTFSLFKTWLFHTTYHRFGAEKYDPNMMRITKGRYRSIIKSTTLDGAELKFKNIVFLLLKGMVNKKALNNLSEVDRVNLIKDIREFQMLVAFSGIALLLMGLKEEDDDEERKRVLNFLINLTTKTQADLAFYMNPNSMGQILNNAIPMIATMGDFVSIIGAIKDTIGGDPFYKTGPWKDDSRVGVSVMRAFPILGGGVKMWNYANNEYSFN